VSGSDALALEFAVDAVVLAAVEFAFEAALELLFGYLAVQVLLF